jgi:hypothetical protein
MLHDIAESTSRRTSATVTRSSGAAFSASSIQSAKSFNLLALFYRPSFVAPMPGIKQEAKPELTILVLIPYMFRVAIITLIISALPVFQRFPNPMRGLKPIGLLDQPTNSCFCFWA